jgi:hypothetical protein
MSTLYWDRVLVGFLQLLVRLSYLQDWSSSIEFAIL